MSKYFSTSNGFSFPKLPDIFHKKYRPEGGIEPLCLSAPTGLKPAPQTTEDHLDRVWGRLGEVYSYGLIVLAAGNHINKQYLLKLNVDIF